MRPIESVMDGKNSVPPRLGWPASHAVHATKGTSTATIGASFDRSRGLRHHRSRTVATIPAPNEKAMPCIRHSVVIAAPSSPAQRQENTGCRPSRCAAATLANSIGIAIK